jgi:hypothetical protein
VNIPEGNRPDFGGSRSNLIANLGKTDLDGAGFCEGFGPALRPGLTGIASRFGFPFIIAAIARWLSGHSTFGRNAPAEIREPFGDALPSLVHG